MKPLTKKQRREIYLMIAERIELRQHWVSGLCIYLSELGLNAQINSSNINSQLKKVLLNFQEFKLFKPVRSVDGLWWSGTVEEELYARIDCMLLCAEMCKP